MIDAVTMRLLYLIGQQALGLVLLMRRASATTDIEFIATRHERTAHQLVLDTEWADIDVHGVENAVAAHEAEIIDILQTSNVLAALAATLERVGARNDARRR